MNTDDMYVRIEWTIPFDNYEAIEGYKVEINNKAGAWVDATLDCQNETWNLKLLA